MPPIDAVAKFRQYQSLPKCKGKTPEQICQMMIAENKLDHQEYLLLKQDILIFPFGTLNGGNKPEDVDWRNFMGVRLTSEAQTKHLDRVMPPMIVNRQYHKQVPFIEVDSKGKPDMSQFTLEGLKERYDSKKYDVCKEKNGNIAVKTKNGIIAFYVGKHPWGGIFATNFMGTRTESAQITEKGEVCNYSVTEIKSGISKTTIYYDGSLNPQSIHEVYKNGDQKNTRYGKNGLKELEEYWKKDGHMAEWLKEYSNGILWKSCKTVNGVQKPEYPLVKEIAKDLSAVGAVGQPKTRPTLKTHVLNGINMRNIDEIWDEYEKQTGKTLTEAIRNEYTVDKKAKAQCINHIEKLFCQNYHDKEKAGKYLADRLYKDIHGTNHSELESHIKLINKNNIKYVMTEYRQIAAEINCREQDNFNDTMHTLRKYLTKPLCTFAAENIIKKVTPFQGLLEAIDKSNISTAKKKELIKYLIDTAMEDKNETAVKNAKKDIKSHPSDMHKVEIDLYRVQNAEEGDMRNPNIGKTEDDKTTKEFLGTKRKQGNVGDCWLIAGLNSIIAKPEMLKELNKLVSYDDKTGIYTVRMKGSNKTYKVTSQEIAEAKHLSTGSLKMRAVEIAMDRQIKEEAYENKNLAIWVDPDFGHLKNVDLNGGFAGVIWRYLWGDNWDVSLKHPDIANENFNNPKRIYAFSLNDPNGRIVGKAKSQKENNYEIIGRHEYSIIGSDTQNVHVLNPWDSDDVITISRKDFAQMGVHIEQYEIPITTDSNIPSSS